MSDNKKLITRVFTEDEYKNLLDILKWAGNLNGIATPYKAEAWHFYELLKEDLDYSKSTKYLRDWGLDRDDDETQREITEYVNNNKFDSIYVDTAKGVLADMHRSHGNIVKSYPALAEKRLKELPPETKVKCYVLSSDGWGCIYDTISVIEVL